jgi:hypothetical protein
MNYLYMAKTMKFKFHKSRSKKLKNNKSKKIKDVKNIKNKIWGKFGSVWSPKNKYYVRLGTSKSISVIRDELVRDNEWYKRVKFMAKRNNDFGNKLKILLK